MFFKWLTQLMRKEDDTPDDMIDYGDQGVPRDLPQTEKNAATIATEELMEGHEDEDELARIARLAGSEH